MGVTVAHFDKNKGLWRATTEGETIWAESLWLKNVSMHVVPEGQEIIEARVKAGMSQEEARFPHAFFIGQQVPERKAKEAIGTGWDEKNAVEVTYDPFKKGSTFIRKDNKNSVHGALLINLKQGNTVGYDLR